MDPNVVASSSHPTKGEYHPHYHGRNGEGLCTGIAAIRRSYLPEGLVALHPVTSRGQVSYACRIEVSVSDLRAILAQLEPQP